MKHKGKETGILTYWVAFILVYLSYIFDLRSLFVGGMKRNGERAYLSLTAVFVFVAFDMQTGLQGDPVPGLRAGLMVTKYIGPRNTTASLASV